MYLIQGHHKEIQYFYNKFSMITHLKHVKVTKIFEFHKHNYIVYTFFVCLFLKQNIPQST